ncbi:MAG TPA: hypothetical protein VF751_08775 [Chthoniobacterales bacterium]
MLKKGVRENLYRIMTDVRAGAHQRSVSCGDFGIVTIWVRAPSVAAAIKKAGFILNDRRYSSIGTLHCYAEELIDDPFAGVNEAERAVERRADGLLAGYDALKESALIRADGLHEVWLGRVGHQGVAEPRRSQAA